MSDLPKAGDQGQLTARAASARGGRLVVEVGECEYCQSFAGEAVAGVDPLPPYHPHCSCVAVA
jgi:hypothetical protein